MNYTWIISRCWRRPTDGKIFKVEYKVIGKKGDLKVSMVDQIRFKQSDSPTPFTDVTEADIVGWVKSKLGSTRENKIYDFLTKEMSHQEINTPLQQLPWNS